MLRDVERSPRKVRRRIAVELQSYTPFSYSRADTRASEGRSAELVAFSTPSCTSGGYAVYHHWVCRYPETETLSVSALRYGGGDHLTRLSVCHSPFLLVRCCRGI